MSERQPPREERGMYCQHGKHIMVADPADQREYHGYVFADPWPCDQPECTPELVAAEMEEEQRAYEDDRWREYQAFIG